LSIENGLVTLEDWHYWQQSYGGGIFNRGELTLEDSTVSGNIADDDGGGIYNGWDSTATLNNSTVSGNMNLVVAFTTTGIPPPRSPTARSRGIRLLRPVVAFSTSPTLITTLPPR
jgi:hypothetical protein